GTTSLVLTLLEQGNLPKSVLLQDAVVATREISRLGTGSGLVTVENGATRDVVDIQYEFLEIARPYCKGVDEETDWVLDQWEFTLGALTHNPEALIGGVDWLSKKYLLDLFRENEGLAWNDPWLQSIDLEYHNIDPERGLFFSLKPTARIAEWNES